MRRGLVLLLTLVVLGVLAAPAGAIFIEEKPDYWGAIGTGPVWSENFGWGLYVQGGYYFTRWLGLGFSVDWSMDVELHEVDYTRTFDYRHGLTTKIWEYERRRQWFPAADLRFRWPLADDMALCFDLGVGAMVDDSYEMTKKRVIRNDATRETRDESSSEGGDGGFLFRPGFVYKFHGVGLGYRFFLVADGSEPGHMITLGVDWDI